MSATTHPAAAVTDRHPPHARFARRAVGSALLGTLVMTGPWTVPPAAGHDGADGAPPPNLAVGLYDVPFGPPPWLGRDAPLVYWPRPTAAAEAGWTTPVTGHPVSASYGTPGGWAAGYHTGVDYATPVGSTVRAVGPGTVVLAGDYGAYGTAVLLHMADGFYTLYAHLDDTAVRAGERVAGGTRLGPSGNSGRSTGPHLHFEVRETRAYGTDVDPEEYLAGHGVDVG